MPSASRRPHVSQVARLFGLVVCLVLPIHALSAQGTIAGAVLALRGQRPLGNAEILIVDLRLSARSDSLGRFRLSDLPPGAHWLIVRRNGYAKFVGVVRVRDGQTIDADVLLETGSTRARMCLRATPACRLER